MNVKDLTSEQKEIIFDAINFIGFIIPVMKNFSRQEKIIEELHDIFLPDRIREEFKGFFKEKEPEQVTPIKRRRTFTGECRVIKLRD